MSTPASASATHPRPAVPARSGLVEGKGFAYRSFWPRDADLTAFAQQGVDTVCIYPSNTDNSLGIPYCDFPPNWVHKGVYDWPALDRQFEQVAKAHPRARIMCIIDLNTPPWLIHYHPLDDSFRQFGRIAADEVWRAETTEYLHAFLRHVEATHGDRIEAYMLSCGFTCEWQDYSGGAESVSRRAAWRRWCIERGHGDPIDIPPASVRDAAAHDLIRDPQANRLGLLYWDFNRWLVGETIAYFSAKAQEVLDHRVPLGMFYGYIFEHADNLLSAGHLDFDRVFDCPDLDFFTAPGTYGDRQIGGASAFMSPARSLMLRGKGFLHEIDHRTYTASGDPLIRKFGREWEHGAYHKNNWSDLPRSLAGLRREFSLSMLSGASLWWFDMWNDWYKPQEIRDAIGAMKKIWDEHAGRLASATQIAVVVDSESALYLDQTDPRIHDVYYRFRAAIGRIGAPYDLISLTDLERTDLSQYRMVVFPALYAVDQARCDLLARTVLRDGRVVVWRDRPGVVRDGAYDERNVERLCGLANGPQAATRAMDGWTSVLEPLAPWSTEHLRASAKLAGVHLYTETVADEPVYAAEGLFAVHTGTGGERRFALPRTVARVRELFSDRIVATDCDSFTDVLNSPDTRLYRLEDR